MEFENEKSEPPSAAAGGPASDPERWVEEYGDYLFKFALARLRDPSQAEDLVQETFLAALRGASPFAGRSAEKSWLAGILKNKIMDHFRRCSRETLFSDLAFYSDEESERFAQEGVFKGGWIHELGPVEWAPNPGAGLDAEAFFKVFHDCADKLPGNVSRVFILREIDGLETTEICSALNISESNVWVMLHRARMALRRCLEAHWFGRSN